MTLHPLLYDLIKRRALPGAGLRALKVLKVLVLKVLKVLT